MLARLIFALILGVVLAFNVPATAPAAPECARRAATPTANLEFLDEGLDNMAITEDPSATPPKKCQMCFG